MKQNDAVTREKCEKLLKLNVIYDTRESVCVSSRYPNTETFVENQGKAEVFRQTSNPDETPFRVYDIASHTNQYFTVNSM